MSRDHDYFVYIATNYTGTVLYIGVTNDLRSRMSQHLLGEGSKFTCKYNVCRLLYREHFREIQDAIAREKKLKGWTRAKKEALIRTKNPSFEDINWQLDPNGGGGCRRPEGPSTSQDSAQDDRPRNDGAGKDDLAGTTDRETKRQDKITPLERNL